MVHRPSFPSEGQAIRPAPLNPHLLLYPIPIAVATLPCSEVGGKEPGMVGPARHYVAYPVLELWWG